MRGLVEAIARERDLNDRKAERVRKALLALTFGLVLSSLETAILVTRNVLE